MIIGTYMVGVLSCVVHNRLDSDGISKLKRDLQNLENFFSRADNRFSGTTDITQRSFSSTPRIKYSFANFWSLFLFNHSNRIFSLSRNVKFQLFDIAVMLT